MKIVLLGYMGSGKSTIGKHLSKTLNSNFIDLDTQIEIQEGMSIPEIFSTKGEIYFRRKENEVLTEILNTHKNFILATGGGTPCYGNVMDFIKSKEDAVSIYLKLSIDQLVDRLYSERQNRPLISHIDDTYSLKDFIRKHLFERSHYYNQATFNIPCDDRSVSEINEKIILKLF